MQFKTYDIVIFAMINRYDGEISTDYIFDNSATHEDVVQYMKKHHPAYRLLGLSRIEEIL